MNSIPLSDALPWDRANPPSHGCMIIITDSTETDGRFLLHTLAAQYLSPCFPQREGNVATSKIRGASTTFTGTSTNDRTRKVLWVSCGAYSEQNILSAIKKIGSKEAMPGIDRVSSSSSSCSWEFISVCDDIITSSVAVGGSSSSSSSNSSACDTDNNDSELFNRPRLSSFVKGLYERIKRHLSSNDECNEHGNFCWLVVLDDVSILCQLLGSYNVMALIQRIRAAIRSQGGCFIIRSSNDIEREQIRVGDPFFSAPQWVCAGGDTLFNDARCYVSPEVQQDLTSWKNILPELADGIIDVMPLQSGFSREAHGRLLCTEILGGRGWIGQNDGFRRGYHRAKTTSNYFCGESDVKAFHLGSKT